MIRRTRPHPKMLQATPERAKEIVAELVEMQSSDKVAIEKLGALKLDRRKNWDSTKVLVKMFGPEAAALAHLAEHGTSYRAQYLSLPKECGVFIDAVLAVGRNNSAGQYARQEFLEWVNVIDQCALEIQENLPMVGRLGFLRYADPGEKLWLIKSLDMSQGVGDMQFEAVCLAPGEHQKWKDYTWEMPDTDLKVGTWVLPQNLSRAKLLRYKKVIKKKDWDALQVLLRATADAA